MVDCVSVELSAVAAFKQGEDWTLLVIAFISSAPFIGASFFTLIFITWPTCCCCCEEDDSRAKKGCSTPAYYASVVIAGTLSVIGTIITGIASSSSVHVYEEVNINSEFVRIGTVTAVFNFIASSIGMALIVTALVCICMSDKSSWSTFKGTLCTS